MPRPALLPFKQWCAELDEALAQLPDPPGWARTIYPTLAQIAAKHARVRTYLSVDAQGQPEALVTLMSGPRGVCEPITQWIVPGFVGVAKPGPGIYEHALSRVGVAAREALFVGDGGSDEHRGARRVGLRTALVTRYLAEAWPERVAERRPHADHEFHDVAAVADHVLAAAGARP